MNYLSICSMIRGEGAYLPEWLAYHRIVGVEHFYIFDNESDPPLSELVPPAPDVTFTRWKTLEPGTQIHANRNAVARFGSATKWMAFIDTDEFMCPNTMGDMRTLLEGFEEFGGLTPNWAVFGTSGLETRPTTLQMEAFVLRAPPNIYPSRHVKTIAQPARIAEIPHPHYHRYKEPWFGVGEDRKPVDSPFRDTSYALVQLNHYYYRSKQEWQEKLARGHPSGRSKAELASHWYGKYEHLCNEVRDESIVRFAPAVRRALRG